MSLAFAKGAVLSSVAGTPVRPRADRLAGLKKALLLPFLIVTLSVTVVVSRSHVEQSFDRAILLEP